VRGKVAEPGVKVGGKCRGAGEKHQAQISNQPSRKDRRGNDVGARCAAKGSTEVKGNGGGGDGSYKVAKAMKTILLCILQKS
jgi:hypothetical protein